MVGALCGLAHTPTLDSRGGGPNRSLPSLATLLLRFLFMMRLLPLAVAVAGLLQYVQAGTYDHRYKKGEHVELWVSKVRGKEPW